jgi:hypothetical protein
LRILGRILVEFRMRSATLRQCPYRQFTCDTFLTHVKQIQEFGQIEEDHWSREVLVRFVHDQNRKQKRLWFRHDLNVFTSIVDNAHLEILVSLRYRVSQKWRTNYLLPYPGCLNVHEKNMEEN